MWLPEPGVRGPTSHGLPSPEHPHSTDVNSRAGFRELLGGPSEALPIHQNPEFSARRKWPGLCRGPECTSPALDPHPVVPVPSPVPSLQPGRSPSSVQLVTPPPCSGKATKPASSRQTSLIPAATCMSQAAQVTHVSLWVRPGRGLLRLTCGPHASPPAPAEAERLTPSGQRLWLPLLCPAVGTVRARGGVSNS